MLLDRTWTTGESHQSPVRYRYSKYQGRRGYAHLSGCHQPLDDDSRSARGGVGGERLRRAARKAGLPRRVGGSPGVRDKRERGRVFLQRPRRMRWEYDPKPGKLFVVNDREVWFYSPADREATRADATKISDARFPFLFLLGQKNLRRQFRTIAFASEDAGASSSTRTIRLVPKRNDTGIREIVLEVSNDGQISKVRQIDEAGSVSEVTLRNVQENNVAPAEAFEFRPPAGVNVRRQN